MDNKIDSSETERLLAQSMLPRLVVTEKGRAAVLSACLTYTLNKMGELKPLIMPGPANVLEIENRIQKHLWTLGQLTEKVGVKPSMKELMAYCDDLAAKLVNFQPLKGDQSEPAGS